MTTSISCCAISSARRARRRLTSEASSASMLLSLQLVRWDHAAVAVALLCQLPRGILLADGPDLAGAARLEGAAARAAGRRGDCVLGTDAAVGTVEAERPYCGEERLGVWVERRL